jgi:hypothetical protein
LGEGLEGAGAGDGEPDVAALPPEPSLEAGEAADPLELVEESEDPPFFELE